MDQAACLDRFATTLEVTPLLAGFGAKQKTTERLRYHLWAIDCLQVHGVLGSCKSGSAWQIIPLQGGRRRSFVVGSGAKETLVIATAVYITYTL
jgi:hypothetical protein